MLLRLHLLSTSVPLALNHISDPYRDHSRPGVPWPERIPENVALFNAIIPIDFRKTLKEEEQPEHAPVPA